MTESATGEPNRPVLVRPIGGDGRSDGENQPSERIKSVVAEHSEGCGREEAACHSGQCILRNYLCDGDYDCEDGSDELNCGTYSPSRHLLDIPLQGILIKADQEQRTRGKGKNRPIQIWDKATMILSSCKKDVYWRQKFIRLWGWKGGGSTLFIDFIVDSLKILQKEKCEHFNDMIFIFSSTV